MLRATDWLDFWKFALDGGEEIEWLVVNEKHAVLPDDQEYADMLMKPPFEVKRVTITPFLPDRQDDTLMAAYTTYGTIVLSARRGFMRVVRTPMWHFIPAEG